MSTEAVNDLQAEVAAMELEDDHSLSQQLALANEEVAKLKHYNALWEYGAARLNRLLADRNSATGRGVVWTDGEENLVCTCHKCASGRRFGSANAAGIWRAFGDGGGHNGECVVKKCFKHLCELQGLICTECDRKGWHEANKSCHIALVDFGDIGWNVQYGSLLGGRVCGCWFHECPMFPRVQAVFEAICNTSVGEYSGWAGLADAAISEVFGLPAREFHRFFTDAEGVDHYMLAVMREKARLCAGDYLAGSEETAR
jgi:hypothetical protein